MSVALGTDERGRAGAAPRSLRRRARFGIGGVGRRVAAGNLGAAQPLQMAVSKQEVRAVRMPAYLRIVITIAADDAAAPAYEAVSQGFLLLAKSPRNMP